ncbi:hypothetical protein H2204_015561 [Knufia peltigerae]|uniref:Uncharacterized protein n=1 Tax=Knufia peltigerae TaxID=1002370 RepID=A0AA38X9F0_9EURO|nr:hypothetical protein H2204_015561 [Knufia peltigerae]
MRDLEDTYHWALMVGPKIEKPEKEGVRYHAKEKVGSDGVHWEFEKRSVSLRPTSMLLVRVLIGKVDDSARLDAILRQTPVRDGLDGWNCVAWLKEALELVSKDKKAVGTSVLVWNTVRKTALDYCNQKKADGRFSSARYNPEKVPTYDLLEHKETTS